MTASRILSNTKHSILLFMLTFACILKGKIYYIWILKYHIFRYTLKEHPNKSNSAFAILGALVSWLGSSRRWSDECQNLKINLFKTILICNMLHMNSLDYFWVTLGHLSDQKRLKQVNITTRLDQVHKTSAPIDKSKVNDPSKYL
jgi:hypothetical protein